MTVIDSQRSAARRRPPRHPRSEPRVPAALAPHPHGPLHPGPPAPLGRDDGDGRRGDGRDRGRDPLGDGPPDRPGAFPALGRPRCPGSAPRSGRDMPVRGARPAVPGLPGLPCGGGPPHGAVPGMAAGLDPDPRHNQQEIILDAIHGALNQDYPDFEVIVIDDGLTDPTPHLAATTPRG